MKRTLITLLAAITFSCFSAIAAQAETLYISVAASMTDAFRELISEFVAKNPGTKVFPNFASSGTLAKQISQGAPADLYVSANPKWMRYLDEQNIVSHQSMRIFAFNTLVFAGKSTTSTTQLKELLQLERIAIGSPLSVPAGQYAKQAMESAGIYSTLKQTNKLVMAKDVRQALIYADQGEVDGAFVYKTDALLAKQAKILFEVPTNLYDRVSYPLAITEKGAEKQASHALYSYIISPAGSLILQKYGFKPAL